MDVLGENEALQQFFDGQDVTGILEPEGVDTSMLEQYLSNDMDPSTFMLPESPPDSGSEPCSPPQVPDDSTMQADQVPFSPAVPPTVPSCRFKERSLGPPACPPQHLSYTVNSSIKTTAPTAPSCLQQGLPGYPDPRYPYLPPTPSQQTGSVLSNTKKRRRSESFEGAPDPCLWGNPAQTRCSLVRVGPECGGGGGMGDALNYDSDGQNGNSGQGACQMLAWDRYQPGQWSPLYNSSYETLPAPGYHVDTDKGFNYSTTDETFVCQKKNHFQVTVHIGMAGNPRYVKTPSGPKPIESFHLKVFGVKLEAQTHLITIEQSQSDRSKKPFLPVKVSLPGDKTTKVTIGRLHFSETTANNMRKKGKPNPDQRYFMLVVGLYASVKEDCFLLVAHVSERIIVRASNPGQFENDSEVLWQRGQAGDTAVCHGRVGINTDAPDEALVVCGNAKVMGTVMHPSDMRAKQNIQEVDSTEQLKRIAQMRIVEYDYKPEFAEKMGIDQVHETGVIAQEVKELLPSAVKEVGDVTCADGEKIKNFLMVDKDQIFMENVGAVKQLCKLTDNLETRIQELEGWNTRLAKLKSTGSLRSNHIASMHRKGKKNDTGPPPQKPAPNQPPRGYLCQKYSHCLGHKVFKASIIMLVATMGICVISITALYMLTLKEDLETSDGNSSHVLPLKTTTAQPTLSTPTVAPSSTPEPWPPDVDFCNLLYCEEVYCCPSDPGNHSDLPTMATPSFPTDHPHAADKIEKLYEKLKSAKDWTNTTVQSIFIKENQQIIDQRYCVQGNCGPGNYSYTIPVSKFVPVNMRVTVQMNTTELLVILQCHAEEAFVCSALMDYTSEDVHALSNTQGYIHEWPLPVARLYRSTYHFRSAVAGQADCSTDPNYAGVLFTEYHFHFYRRCN
ncbi:myelin regulatory factor-like protein [Megalops cyprinoides]|uniref:myelin regulatory factor-like protein n=1 Tax=Megalops cyprinoides TaxID=118141 RepID=UPI001864FC44|nr:myelin regulatory factor-like protein [Megalops cyprinoides]